MDVSNSATISIVVKPAIKSRDVDGVKVMEENALMQALPTVSSLTLALHNNVDSMEDHLLEEWL
jgi:hypothetical protein